MEVIKNAIYICSENLWCPECQSLIEVIMTNTETVIFYHKCLNCGYIDKEIIEELRKYK